MKQCVYCKQVRKLTVEHIFPKCFVKRQPDSDARFTLRANRITENLPTIRDVCSSCNNEVLSELDEYMCGLYDLYFFRPVPRYGAVLFEYNYDLLARWLLKVLYNSARKNKTNYSSLAQFTEYILGQNANPTNLIISTLLLVPFSLSIKQRQLLKGTVNENLIEMAPRHISIQKLTTSIGDTNFVLANGVMINSFCFFVSILPSNLPSPDRRRRAKEILDELGAKFKGVRVMDPKLKKTILKASETDIRTMKKDSFELFRGAYGEYFERRRRKSEQLKTPDGFPAS